VLNFDDPIFVFSVLIEGVKYYASEPRMLGRTFLRLVSKLLVWFGLFVHPFSHICNIGHVNYRLQFTTHIVIYTHLHNTL